MRDYITIAAQYQADVLAGRVPACKWVQLACSRNRRDLDRQGSAGFPYRFDPEAGRRICHMAEMLPHIKGPLAFVTGTWVDEDTGRALNVWNTIRLEPWQCWLLTTIYGWRRVGDGTRRFKVAFTLVPRKNAKSTIAAICVLYALVADGESGAEVYSAATTREQAKVIAEIAWEMARRSPGFCKFFGVKVGSKTTLSLTVPASASKFGPLSADAGTLDGLNVSFAAVDEFHAHKTRGVYDVLDTATGARLQPMLFLITTAGVEIGGICHEKLQYLQKILTGALVDDSWFGVYYTLDPGDRIENLEVQRKANPNFAVSVTEDDLARKVAETTQNQASLNNVLTKHFNVWIRTESAWMSADLWQTCRRETLRLEDMVGYPCRIGVDLAEVQDIAALALLFTLGPGSFAAFFKFFLPQATVDRSPIAQLSGWVHEGHITATPGDQADFQAIERQILEWVERFKVLEIDFDRALAAHMQQDLKRALEPRMGRDAIDRLVLTVPQNVETMDRAMKMTERLVLAQGLQHTGNPAMAWMVSNVVVERNYKDEIYPRKAGGKDSPHKIDGPVAFWNALSQAMVETAPPRYAIHVLGGKRR